MFSWFKKKEQFTVIPVKHNELDFVIKNSKKGEEVKAIDKNKLALISVKKQDDRIAVSIEFERDLGTDIFTETHKTIVDSTEEAVLFFNRFGISKELSWLGGYRRKVNLRKERKISHAKAR